MPSSCGTLLWQPQEMHIQGHTASYWYRQVCIRPCLSRLLHSLGCTLPFPRRKYTVPTLAQLGLESSVVDTLGWLRAEAEGRIYYASSVFYIL